MLILFNLGKILGGYFLMVLEFVQADIYMTIELEVLSLSYYLIGLEKKFCIIFIMINRFNGVILYWSAFDTNLLCTVYCINSSGMS